MLTTRDAVRTNFKSQYPENGNSQPTSQADITFIEVDSDLGAAQAGAAQGAEFLKQIIQKDQLLNNAATFRAIQSTRDLAGSSIGPQSNYPPRRHPSRYPFAKSIDTIYEVLEHTCNTVDSTLKSGSFPIVLAGDHSTAAGTIAGIKQAFPQSHLGVIWIDAHADIHSPYTTPSGNMHGMPLAIATGFDTLDGNLAHQSNNPVNAETRKLWESCKALGHPHQPNLEFYDLVYVSVRETELTEDCLLSQYNIPVVSAEAVRRAGASTVAKQCLEHLENADLIYVSFDVDSLDSSICMGTGTPAKDGLWLEEAAELNAALLQDPRVCCWEICEVNPTIDTLGTMAHNSSQILRAAVQALKTRRKSEAVRPQSPMTPRTIY